MDSLSPNGASPVCMVENVKLKPDLGTIFCGFWAQTIHRELEFRMTIFYALFKDEMSGHNLTWNDKKVVW